MPKYILECPQCETRYKLKKYIPEKRLRCRHCDAIIMIPSDNVKTADDARKEAMGNAFRKKHGARWLRVAVPSVISIGLLVVVVLVAVDKFQRVNEQKNPRVSESDSALAQFNLYNRESHFPLSLGTEWIYDGKDFSENMKIVHTYKDKRSGNYQAQVAVTRGAKTTTRIFSIQRDAVYLLEEDDGTNFYRYEKPLLFLKYPLKNGDSWEWSGLRRNLGSGESEKMSLKASVTASETVPVKEGIYTCLKVAIKGLRGKTSFEETRWYSTSTGLIKRESLSNSEKEEMVLRTYRPL